MSDRETKALERALRAEGRLPEFVDECLEGMPEHELFRLREDVERRLVEASLASKKDPLPVAPLAPGPTSRGFWLSSFQDRYGENCSLQESSLATEAAIWFGIDTPEIRVFNRHGPDLKVNVRLEYDDPGRGMGWGTVRLSADNADILQSGRMHLTQSRMEELLPALQHFVETGYLLRENE